MSNTIKSGDIRVSIRMLANRLEKFHWNSVTCDFGRAYARLVYLGSALCFVRLSDGAILKARYWASPGLKRTYGSVLTDDYGFSNFKDGRL